MIEQFKETQIKQQSWIYGTINFGRPVTMLTILDQLTIQSLILLPDLGQKKISSSSIMSTLPESGRMTVDTALCQELFPYLNLKLYTPNTFLPKKIPKKEQIGPEQAVAAAEEEEQEERKRGERKEKADCLLNPLLTKLLKK